MESYPHSTVCSVLVWQITINVLCATLKVSHMLFTCCKCISFWNHFTCWWQIKFRQCVNLSESVILYGWHQDSDSNIWITLNYCLIIAKYHIFATNIRVGILDFESFILRLSDKFFILRALATKNNQLHQFRETWAALF